MVDTTLWSPEATKKSRELCIEVGNCSKKANVALFCCANPNLRYLCKSKPIETGRVLFLEDIKRKVKALVDVFDGVPHHEVESPFNADIRKLNRLLDLRYNGRGEALLEALEGELDDLGLDEPTLWSQLLIVSSLQFTTRSSGPGRIASHSSSVTHCCPCQAACYRATNWG